MPSGRMRRVRNWVRNSSHNGPRLEPYQHVGAAFAFDAHESVSRERREGAHRQERQAAILGGAPNRRAVLVQPNLTATVLRDERDEHKQCPDMLELEGGFGRGAPRLAPVLVEQADVLPDAVMEQVEEVGIAQHGRDERLGLRVPSTSLRDLRELSLRCGLLPPARTGLDLRRRRR
jgi:hypothetical protein